ncbi:MAG: dihydrodipicolinate synthase family protein [Spirochaetales bacterium]|nr:dihydrodipicolinate synthase family protein [Spirochaetales bacterium]
MQKELKGVIPALVTPFDNNLRLSTGALKDLVKGLIEENVGGLYCCGSTGEAFLLSLEERKKTVAAVVEAAQGKVPVVVQVGNVNVDESVELAKFCASNGGVDQISALPPIYYGYKPAEIVNYFQMIMSATDLPMMVYNIPHLSGKSLSSFGEVFEDPRVTGIKHTTSDFYSLHSILEKKPDLKVYFGQDEQALSGLAMGAVGIIGSTYNNMADLFVKLSTLHASGENVKALALQKEINKLITLIIECGVYNSVKFLAGEKFGIDLGSARAPFLPLTSEQKGRLQEASARLYENS